MARRCAIAVASVSLLLLAGCASSGSPAETETPTSVRTRSPNVTLSPTPTTAVDVATPEQWASLIAQVQFDVEEANANWEAATCSSLAVDRGALDCRIMLMTMGTVAKTAALEIGGAATADSPTYLGAPTAEILNLVGETVSAAEAAGVAAEPVYLGDACPGENCVRDGFAFEMAWDDLRSALVAWSPYL